LPHTELERRPVPAPELWIGAHTKATPAMASGLTDHVWTLEEVGGLLDQTPASQ
jgi:hypothetical protein